MKPFALISSWIGLLATCLPCSAGVLVGTTSNGTLAFENIAGTGASVSSISITLPPSTFFDSSDAPPGQSSVSFRVSNNTGAVGVVLPNNAATDGQRTASFSFAGFEPGNSVVIACDYDLYSNPDAGGAPVGAPITVTYSNGHVESGTLESITRTVAGASWDVSLSLAGLLPSPQLPRSQTVLTGQNASFAVIPAPSGPYTYQWLFNGTAIPGAVNNSVLITSVDSFDEGMYQVIISDANGSSTFDAFLTVKPSGAVHWWRGDDNAVDSVGAGHGTVEGGLTYTAARKLNGFTFGSDADHVSIPYSADLNFQPSGFTCEFWMRGIKNQPQGLFLVMDKSHGIGGNNGWSFQGLDSSTGVLNFSSGTGTGFVSIPGVDVLDGVLHHVVGTWDGNSLAYYIDGILQGTSALPNPAGNALSMNIGYWYPGARPFRGTVDEVLVYSRALSATEVTRNYSLDSGRSYISTHPIGAAVPLGTPVSLSVVAVGNPLPTYQWRLNGSPVFGATGKTYSFSATTSGSYDVVVTNAVGSATSNAAVLTVTNDPPIANAGGPYSISTGQSLTLNGSGSNDPNVGDSIVSYQWDVNGDGNYADATGVSPTLSWSALQSLGFGSSGVYTVWLRVTDTSNAIGAASATLNVNVGAPNPSFPTAGTVPVTANGFTATGLTLGPMTLSFDPAPGQVLTLLNNTSANPIGGVFTNLPAGGTLATSYGGRDFLFVANYSGGDGNDLTLTLLNPEIAVEEPAGTDLEGNTIASRRWFGGMAIGRSTPSKTLTVRNTGSGPLNLAVIGISGMNPGSFPITGPATPVSIPPGGSRTIVVTFAPAGTDSAGRVAWIEIVSDDADENTFSIFLEGIALSTTTDGDSDGMNDWAEFSLSGVGFDWQTGQPLMVSALYAGANEAGLFTPGQVQALHLGTPLLAREPLTGQFTLTVGFKKSTDLETFMPFPVTAPQVTVNGQGKLEFRFTAPEPAAFFRLETD